MLPTLSQAAIFRRSYLQELDIQDSYYLLIQRKVIWSCVSLSNLLSQNQLSPGDRLAESKFTLVDSPGLVRIPSSGDTSVFKRH